MTCIRSRSSKASKRRSNDATAGAGNRPCRVRGTTTVPGPDNFMVVHVGGDITGDLIDTVEVDALGNWDFRERNSQTLPNGATTVTVHSTGGAIVTVPLQVR